MTSASEPYPSSPPPSRPIPITASFAGTTPSAGVLARITASSADCSTASQTDVSALQTSRTSSMPSRSAEATRASSRRRRVRAAAIARTGSAMPRGRSDQRAGYGLGVDVEQLGPGRTVGVLLDHLRRPHQQLGHVGRGAQHPHQSLGDRTLVAQSAQIPTLFGQRLADSPVGQQAAVRVGGVRQPVQQPGQQHRLDPAAAPAQVDQRAQVGQCALRAFVAQCGELTLGGGRRQAAAPAPPTGRPTPAAVGRKAWRATAIPEGSAV